MQNMIKDNRFSLVDTGHVAGTSAIDSAILDAAGYDGVLFAVLLGTVTAGSVLTAQVQDNTVNSTSGMGNTGTAATYTDVAAESSNTALVVDVVNVQKRFVRCHFTRATQNAVVLAIVAILYRNKNKPSVQDATVIANAFSNAAA